MLSSWFSLAGLERAMTADASAAALDGEAENSSKPEAIAYRVSLVTAIILSSGMAVLGVWVSSRIANGIQQNTAQSVALYMESIIEPLVQELATDDARLSESSLQAIEDVFRRPADAGEVNSIRIWRRDGTLAYPKTITLAAAPPQVSAALAGSVRVGETILGESESGPPSKPVVSIFSPMHRLGTSKVIGVAEYIEPADHLARPVANGSRDVWLLLAAITLGMLGLLLAVLFNGMKVIATQHRRLGDRFREQLRLNVMNTELRRELQQARLQSVEINEQLLGRVGADLHDGPAQLLALAILDLDIVGDAVRQNRRTEEDAAKALANVHSAASEALKEIRDISSGLVLPEQQWKSCADAIRGAVEAHERRTGDIVDCQLGELPPSMPELSMVCLFRAVQEGLNNAHRHAGGKGLALRTHPRSGGFAVEVSDSGPGFDVGEKLARTSRLGLAGLRHRIAAIGGNFQVISSSGNGTRLIVTLPNSAGGF